MGCGQRQAIFDSVSSTLQQKEAHSASTDPQSEVDGRAKTIKWCTDNKLQQVNVLFVLDATYRSAAESQHHPSW